MNTLTGNWGLFHSGPVVWTPGAEDLLERNGKSPYEFLNRHLSGDWGEVDKEDKQANNDALESGARILSAYTVGGEKLWVITDAEISPEHERYATTLLLPEEY